jgi:hypothetical protein
MSLHLPRLYPVSGRALLFLLFTIFLAQVSFAQSAPVAPAVTIHQGLPANYDWYQKFLYGGGTYVALTLYPEEFFTSSDGIDWNRIPGPNLGFQQSSVANADQIPDYTYGAGRWVVVSDSGKIFSSPDLVTWTQASGGTTATLHGVNYVDSLFIATGDSATLLTSPDGITWTRQTITASTTAESFFHADYGNGTLVISSNSSDFTNGFNYISNSGITGPWQQDSVGYETTTKFIHGKFYINRPAAAWSTDAHNWLPITGANFFADIFADSSRVYLVNDSTLGGPFNYSYAGTIAASSDGINFGPATLISDVVQSGYYANGHYFTYFHDAMGSTDATNWAMLGSYGPTAAYNGSTYVKVSPTQLSGYISTSPDFIHWTPADTVTTGLNCLVYDTTQFTTFGPTSYISPNGSSWSVGPSPALDYAAEDFHVVYGGGTYVAWWVETPTNYVWYSHDGINWGGSTLPPPSQTDYYNGYNSAVTEITNIQYINGKFWLMNSADGGTPAAIFVSSNGENFDTVGFNNSLASGFNIYSFDQLLYVPDSAKYYIFGVTGTIFSRGTFFTASTTNPLDSTIVLQNHTTLTGNLSNAYLYNGQDVSYGVTNFVNPGGFDFAYSHGHFVGGAIGPGNAYDGNIPPVSYLLWSSDGATWDGSLLPNYAKVLSNIVVGDTFHLEAWNNYEIIAAYMNAISQPDSLLNFNAVAVDNSSALLTWKVAADTAGTAYREFVIQRSMPSTPWVTLDSVADVAGTVSYRYTDPAPAVGYDDYRLILRGPDSSSFSPVRQVHITEPQHIAVFPNPARNHVTLIAEPAIMAVVTLYGADGRQLQSTSWNGPEVTLSLIGLPTGTYHVVIRATDGTVYERQVFHVN